MQFRHSAQRQALLACLRATRAHPTAAALFACLRRSFPRLSLGTVYRNLGILQSQGLVLQLAGDGSEARYDADLAPHAHFFCRHCGEVFDLPLAPAAARALAPSPAAGLRLESVRVEWQGLCRKCQPRRSSPGGKHHEPKPQRH